MRSGLPSALGALVVSPARRDFLFLLFDRVFRFGAGLILGGLVGRHLGTEAFGWLNYAGATMALGAAVANLGLDSIIVREIVRNPGDADEIVGAALVLRTFVGLILAVSIWASSSLISGEEPAQRALVGILALGTLVPALTVPASWFQARTESRIAVRAGLIGFFGGALLRLWLLAQGASVNAFAWAMLAEAAASGLLVSAAMFRRGGRFGFQAVWRHGRSLMEDSWPLLVGAMAATVYMRIDQIMLRWLSGADAVGLYAAATRMSEAAYAVPLLMGTSLMATLTAAAGDNARFEALVERYFQASAALGYLLAVPAIVVAPWLLRLIYGEAFAGAGVVAQIHLVSVIFVSISVARGRVLVIHGLTRFAMFTAVIGGTVSLALNVVLIPRWGPVGAALATVAAHAMAALGSTLLYPPTRALGLSQVRALLRPRIRLAD